MAIKKDPQLLTDDFLLDLYQTSREDNYVLKALAENIELNYLPDKYFQEFHKHIVDRYRKTGSFPAFSSLLQTFKSNNGVRALVEDISNANKLNTKEALLQLEDYIRQVRFQKAFSEAGDAYNKDGSKLAVNKMMDFADWSSRFSLAPPDFVDVIEQFGERFRSNKNKFNDTNKMRPVTRFYIDELDRRNNGRNLRGQLTCFLAPTGVGKSHIARWVGKCACQVDGLNVLHIQLEGSEEEAFNAYAASIINCSTFSYETGNIDEGKVKSMEEELKAVTGKLCIKSYPKFDAHITTSDIRRCIMSFNDRYDTKLDVVIVDSIDLLDDVAVKSNPRKEERIKRINVANDLKDLATDENVWVVGTYQSTIESKEWFDDESKLLTAYNTAEAKGLSRPLTHLISLNQSSREAKEHTMRIHVAKSRFFATGDAFRIATDYEHEAFYDRVRTMNINKVN